MLDGGILKDKLDAARLIMVAGFPPVFSRPHRIELAQAEGSLRSDAYRRNLHSTPVRKLEVQVAIRADWLV